MGLTLYDITESIAALNDLIANGESDEEIQSMLDGYLEGLLPDKVEGYAKVLRQMGLEAEAYKAEEHRLADRRRSIESTVSRMKERLVVCLDATGTKEIKAGTFKVRVQDSTPSVVVTDMDAVPGEFVREEIKRVVDKRSLLDALKGGAELAGAHIKRGRHVRIR